MSSQNSSFMLFQKVGALLLLLLACGFAWTSCAHAADEGGGKKQSGGGPVTTSVGVTRKGSAIRYIQPRAGWDLQSEKTQILLVGGLDGKFASLQKVMAAWRWFYGKEEGKQFHDRYTLTMIPTLFSDPGSKEPINPESIEFPPQSGFYHTQTQAEAAYLWRWIGMYGPDLVIDVRTGKETTWEIPRTDDKKIIAIAEIINASRLDEEQELISALMREKPAETGVIPAVKVHVKSAGEPVTLEERFGRSESDNWLEPLLKAMDKVSFKGPSPARAELQARLKRTPLEVLRELSTVYGQDLSDVQYIPSLALIARLRLGELTNDPSQLEAVEAIVSPYYEGEKTPATKNGSQLAGHLIFTELAAIDVPADKPNEKRKARYLELAKGAADLAFDPSGELRPSMPHHSEMSDALFMGGPILAQVGELTSEDRYYEACWRHLQFMRELVLRDDGLYRHSPLDEAAWGRGNGFPALGLTLCIASFPKDHPDRPKLIEALKAHLNALLKHQDKSGAWHQVIDHPESYQELTCTCMIGYSLARGVREGWLEKETYWPAAQKAWQAANTRIGHKGRLIDVCTGTGKQRSLRDYYDRPAILGTDARGGAMAMIFAAEMAQHEAYQSNE